jgi:N-acetylmuramoyl-L-alanine amidase
MGGVVRGCGRLCRSAAEIATVLAVGVAVASAETVLRDVRCLGGREYSRVVLDLSDTVAYRMQKRAGAAGGPPQVYVDLIGARTASGFTIECARRGPLTRIRAAQTDRGLRLMLDVPGLSEARAFPMLDPFRLVVDVEAHAPSKASASSAPSPARGRHAPAATRERSGSLKIVLDAGHGGKDPGARGVNGVLEKEVVLAIALELRDLLQRMTGVKVVLTRDRDVFLSLEERTAIANAEEADLFVSIHANASPNSASSGIETYYLNNTDDQATLRLAALENGLVSVTGQRQRDRDVALLLSSLIQSYKVGESVAFAEDVQRNLVDTLQTRWPGVVDLGVKQGPFYVLVGAGMPCILVEASFLTHPEEGTRLAQPSYRRAVAEGILRGIRHFVDNHRGSQTL